MLKFIRSRFLKNGENKTSIEDAERLFLDGEVFKAIDLLASVNKEFNSPVVAERIVRMRNEGFFAIQRNKSEREWPPKTSNAISSIGVIPEKNNKELTEEHLRNGIIGHGALIVKELLPERQIVKLRECIDKAIYAYDARESSDNINVQGWFSPLKTFPESELLDFERKWVRDASGVLAADSPFALETLITALKDAGIIAVIEAYFGEKPVLSLKKTTLRRVPPDTNGGWHQDGAFLGDNIRSVNVWIALTDCGTDAPSMDMIPKRLDCIIPTGTGGASFSWSLDDKAAQIAGGACPPKRLHFNAGDAILFDEMNLHKTAADPGMAKVRYAIEAWFFAPSCYPVEQIPILV